MVGIGKGFPPPQPTKGSGGASWAPPRTRLGSSRAPQTPFQHLLSVTERFRWKENALHLHLNIVIILTTVTAEICLNSVDFLRWAFRGVDPVTPLEGVMYSLYLCVFYLQDYAKLLNRLSSISLDDDDDDILDFQLRMASLWPET